MTDVFESLIDGDSLNQAINDEDPQEVANFFAGFGAEAACEIAAAAIASATAGVGLAGTVSCIALGVTVTDLLDDADDD